MICAGVVCGVNKTLSVVHRLEEVWHYFALQDSIQQLGITGIIGFCDYPGTGTKQSQNPISHSIQ